MIYFIYWSIKRPEAWAWSEPNPRKLCRPCPWDMHGHSLFTRKNRGFLQPGTDLAWPSKMLRSNEVVALAGRTWPLGIGLNIDYSGPHQCGGKKIIKSTNQ